MALRLAILVCCFVLVVLGDPSSGDAWELVAAAQKVPQETSADVESNIDSMIEKLKSNSMIENLDTDVQKAQSSTPEELMSKIVDVSDVISKEVLAKATKQFDAAMEQVQRMSNQTSVAKVTKQQAKEAVDELKDADAKLRKINKDDRHALKEGYSKARKQAKERVREAGKLAKKEVRIMKEEGKRSLQKLKSKGMMSGDLYDQNEDRVERASDKMEHHVEHAKDKLEDKVESNFEKIEREMEKAEDQLEDVWEERHDQVNDAIDHLRDRMYATTEDQETNALAASQSLAAFGTVAHPVLPGVAMASLATLGVAAMLTSRARRASIEEPLLV